MAKANPEHPLSPDQIDRIADAVAAKLHEKKNAPKKRQANSPGEPPPLSPKAVKELQEAYDEGLLSAKALDEIDPYGQVGEADDSEE